MVLIPDPWLSETLSRPAYRVSLKGHSSSGDEKIGLSEFLAEQSSNIFIYCKIPTSSLQSVHVLETLGFRLIDTNAIFEKPVSATQPSVTKATIQFAVPKDETGVVELARRSFQYSRFHLDPLIHREQADRIKAEWVRNYFLGKRGKWLITAKVNGVSVGFLLLLREQEHILTIDLIAVDQAYQRKGIARSMIAYAETHCEDIERVRVGTQVANISSINLYEKMGFRLVDTNYVFHYHHS